MAVNSNQPVSVGNLKAAMESSGGGGGLFDGVAPFEVNLDEDSVETTISGTEWRIKGVGMPINSDVTGLASPSLLMVTYVCIWANNGTGTNYTWSANKNSNYINISRGGENFSFKVAGGNIPTMVSSAYDNSIAQKTALITYGDNSGMKICTNEAITTRGGRSSYVFFPNVFFFVN